VQSRSASISSTAESIGVALAIRLTPSLRKMAVDSGWPTDLVSALSLKVDDNNNLYVDYPENLAQRIEDEEYGSFQTMPNAVIRPFIMRSSAAIAEEIDQSALDKLAEILEVM